MAEIGKARNNHTRKHVKIFIIGLIILNMTVLATARAK
jgi:hypothetical protein